MSHSSLLQSRSQNKTLRQTFINDVAIATKLNASLPVAFLIHGYIDNVNRTWVQRTIRGEYGTECGGELET